jgi:hypothetical protein
LTCGYVEVTLYNTIGLGFSPSENLPEESFHPIVLFTAVSKLLVN